jgi:hypothetical protein
MGKEAGALLTNEAIPQLSEVTGGARVRAAKQSPGSLFAVKVCWHWITGISLSVTVISCRHVLELPWISVAVHVTVVKPTG